MNNRKPKTDLPDAVSYMQEAIDAMIDPQTSIISRKKHHAPSIYMQLWDAIAGQQGSGGGVARSMPPFWCDAVDLLNEIDTAIEAWQPQAAGVPPTVGRLRVIQARTWRPQDVRQIQQITKILHTWTIQIIGLLNPEGVKYISAPCPACGATTVYRKDSAGENVKAPALQIITDRGCTCHACHAHWGPELYLHLCRVLGFQLPEGVLA